MMTIFLPDSKGTGIKPGTVQCDVGASVVALRVVRANGATSLRFRGSEGAKDCRTSGDREHEMSQSLDVCRSEIQRFEAFLAAMDAFNTRADVPVEHDRSSRRETAHG
jgi:hypothetical protein